MKFLVLDSGKCNPALNMAMDEALLEFVNAISLPVLRFYGWTIPAATFGYSQRFADVEKMTLLRPLIRRPTGGGLVPHDRDWTYSLVFPTDSEWFQLTAKESYRAVHEWVRDAFTECKIETALAPQAIIETPGQCFVGAEESDLLWFGKKIAGAAQRRNKLGLLIQGSVQPPPIPLDRSAWQNGMVQGRDWESLKPDGALMERAEELAALKYSQEMFNRKR